MKQLALRICVATIFALAAIVAQAQTCTGSAAQLTSPTPGSTLPAGPVTFTWCDAGGDYFLTLETIPGAHDIFYALVTVTSVTLGPACSLTPPIQCIPDRGETIYATLQTQIKGVWLTPFQYTFTAAQAYHVTNLVSDLAGTAPFTDTHLINPFGLAHGKTTPWWVSDNGTGVSTLYDGTGNPFPVGSPLVVTIPTANGTGTGSPTGTVALGNEFVFVTLDGTISAWSSGTSAVIKVSNPGKVYTGCTVAMLNTAPTLYVANSAGGIEAYDTAFKPVALPAGAFTDINIPPGFTPFNVQSAGGKLYVTFSNALPGAGAGYVDAFDSSGTLLLSLRHGSWMNVPWGVAMAPANFGKFFSHALLVGQLGGGKIAAFNPSTGKFLGLMKTSTGAAISINGLWGLGFGNNGSAGPSTTLFFTAGSTNFLHGLFGTILPD